MAPDANRSASPVTARETERGHGAGTVGKEVVRVLLRRGASVTALLRARPRGTSLPEAVEVVTGDLGDADAVRRAVERAGVVFFVNPHEAEEETYAEHVLAACEQTNTRLVFLGVHVDARWAWLRAVLRTTYGAFFQNDEVFHDDILGGRYTQPLGVKGVTQVDVRDIAEVAATVLLDPSHPAGCFPITGPTSVSGPEAAAIWAEALGHEVVYAGHEREAWQNAIRTHLTGHKREDWLKTYEALAKMSGGPDPKELARTTELLGRPPRSYRDYVTDIAVTVAARRPARAA